MQQLDHRRYTDPFKTRGEQLSWKHHFRNWGLVKLMVTTVTSGDDKIWIGSVHTPGYLTNSFNTYLT